MYNFISKIEELDIPCRYDVEANHQGSVQTVVVKVYGNTKHMKFSITLDLMDKEKIIVAKYDRFLKGIKTALAEHYLTGGVII